MSEKRLIVDEDYNIVDIVTGEWLDDTQVFDLANELYEENEQLRKQIQIYEQLISSSYVGEEETLDGFVGKYVIWEDELQEYKKKIKKVMNDE